jgi:hypothetical protein
MEQEMTWIKTVPFSEAGESLRNALESQAKLYPAEYAAPVESLAGHEGDGSAGIVMSHSLIPGALYHAFATFGTLMSPDLPLQRRQQEMIAATVSALNRCFY